MHPRSGAPALTRVQRAALKCVTSPLATPWVKGSEFTSSECRWEKRLIRARARPIATLPEGIHESMNPVERVPFGQNV